MKERGSAGGHNGLKHIEHTLQTNQYCRLRIGIGSDYDKGKQIDFVLGKWQTQEMGLLPKVVEAAACAIEAYVGNGIQSAMNVFNGEVK